MDRPRLERLHRQIAACDSYQAVLRAPGKSFFLVPVASARFDAIMDDQIWAARVLGVFSPDVTLPVLLSEIVGVGQS